MKRLLLIVLVGGLCACGHRDRPLMSSEPRVPDPVEVNHRKPAETAASAAEPQQIVPPPPHSDDARPRDVRDPDAVLSAINGQLKDVYFDYDRVELRPDAMAALREDAALLSPILPEFPNLKITVEGHCDERGSAEYNLGLGDRRAARAVEILRQFGLPGERLIDISYGKEQPQCAESQESCWRLNRRVHLVALPGWAPTY